jgi:hypothetical protein
MEQQQPSHPLPAPTKQKKSRGKKVLLIAGGLILIFIILAAMTSKSSTTSTTSTPAAPDKTTSQQTQASAAPAHTPQVLLDLTGTGTKTTQKFTAASDWDLSWSYDCNSSLGNTGNFIVSIYNGDGSLSTDNQEVNQLGAKGADVEHYHTGGTFYLEVNSECSWHVTAKG